LCNEDASYLEAKVLHSFVRTFIKIARSAEASRVLALFPARRIDWRVGGRMKRRRATRTGRFVRRKKGAFLRLGKGRIAGGYTRRVGYYGRYNRKKNGCGPGGELKFFDVTVDDAVIASGGFIHPTVVNIPQGITESTRVGRKICVTNINWHFRAALVGITAATSPPNGDIVRVVIYLDKQCNGAAAGVADILENTHFQSFNNLVNKGRFRILMDRTYDLNYLAGSGITSSQDYCAVQINDSFFKRCSIPVEYSATTGAITEIRSNNIGIMLITEQGKANFESVVRIRYADG